MERRPLPLGCYSCPCRRNFSHILHTGIHMRTIAIRGLFFAAVFLGVLLPGCIVIRTTEHRIKLNSDGSGEALLRLIDIRSDAVTDSLVRRDFVMMMKGVEEQGVKEFERSGRTVTTKQFSVRGDTLMCEVSYTFQKVAAVEGLRQTADGLVMIVGEGREVVKTNGTVEAWQANGQRIVWDADAKRLMYVMREKTLPASTSLASLYLKSYR